MDGKKAKLKWKVEEAPTGAYRSFSKRGWPSAYLPDGRAAFSIVCEDSYEPSRVKTGDHKELKINVADWSAKPDTFVWKTLKHRAATLTEAKETAAHFLERHPHMFEQMDDAESRPSV